MKHVKRDENLMNVFVLDLDPSRAAEALCNKHVVKMCLETAQILCTVMGGKYKPTHTRHPCVRWAGASRDNADWLVQHGLAIGAEYTYRYGKRHRSVDVIEDCASRLLQIPAGSLTQFALAMPEEFHTNDAVRSYRTYYQTKRRFAAWTRRSIPDWWDTAHVTCAPEMSSLAES